MQTAVTQIPLPGIGTIEFSYESLAAWFEQWCELFDSMIVLEWTDVPAYRCVMVRVISDLFPVDGSYDIGFKEDGSVMVRKLISEDEFCDSVVGSVKELLRKG